MKLIIDEEVRRTVLSIWKQIVEKYGEKADINDQYIENLEKTIHDFQNSSRLDSNEYFKKHISLTYIGVLSLGTLSLVMDIEGETPPIKWNYEGKGDPNLALRSLLINITNSYLAAIRLIEEGLDFQARILLSNICELTWLTLVLISRKDWMETYLKIDIVNEKENWKTIFGDQSLIQELAVIETELGTPNLPPSVFENLRKEIHNFYTLNIHHSYYWCVKGSFSLSTTEDNLLMPNTFGMASKDSVETLEKLNKSLCYFLVTFGMIMEKEHGLKYSSEDQLWVLFEILKYSFIQLCANFFEVEVLDGECD